MVEDAACSVWLDGCLSIYLAGCISGWQSVAYDWSIWSPRIKNPAVENSANTHQPSSKNTNYTPSTEAEERTKAGGVLLSENTGRECAERRVVSGSSVCREVVVLTLLHLITRFSRWKKPCRGVNWGAAGDFNPIWIKIMKMLSFNRFLIYLIFL